jgi:plastocyanin
VRYRITTATALAAGVALAAPVVAQAATKTVDMGVPLKSQPTFQAVGGDVNDFFPHGTTIHVGDSIKFVPTGFHTVELLKKGAKAPLPLIIPTGQNVSGANDAAGNPFWFNGLPQLGFNPALATGSLGKTVTYNGSKGVESGLPLAAKPKPMTVKFTKAGTFTFYCNVHVGMKGTVKVLAKAKKIPTGKQDATTLSKQVSRDLKIAKALPKTQVSSGTVHVGQSGAFGVEFFGFLPGNMTVPAGTTVTFAMTPKSYEIHTATTGPGNPETEPSSYLGMLTASLNNPVPDPAAIYPSDPPPAGVPSVTPTSHGNGFWNSGAMSVVKGTPLPGSSQVKFNTPGTYQFYCLVHPFMHGTITVR